MTRFRCWMLVMAFAAGGGHAGAVGAGSATPTDSTPTPRRRSLEQRIEERLASDPALAERLGKPTHEIEHLAWMVGTWEVSAVVAGRAAGEGGGDTGVSTVTRVLDGTWLQVEDRYADGNQDLGFIGYDGATKQYRAIAIDSYGTAALTSGSAFVDGRLALTGRVRILGEDVTLRQTIVRTDAREYRVTNEEQDEEGAWHAIDEYRYRKRSD